MVSTASCKCVRSWAPTFWATTTLAPVCRPIRNMLMTLVDGLAADTAARALAPTNRPTITASTRL